MPDATSYELAVDWDNDGSFATAGDDITADLIHASIQRGYSGPLARVAIVGRATFTLDNDDQTYSPPLDATVLPMRPVRFQMTYNGSTETLFRGYLADISPQTDQYGMQQAVLACVDAMELLDIFEGDIAIQIDAQADDIVNAVVNAAYTPPSESYDAGINLFPTSCERWSWSVGISGQESGQSRNPTETVSAIDRITDACTSDWGRFFIAKDGAATFYNRHRMPLDDSTDLTLNDDMMQMDYRKTKDTIYNHVEVTCNPRDIAEVVEIIGEITQTHQPPILEANGDPGDTRAFTIRFRDPSNRTKAIGGYSCITPVAGTDYITTDDEPGAGTDQSANVNVSETFYGDHAEIELENTNAFPVWVQTLQVRGYAVRSRDMITMTASDATSITAYGKRKLPILVPMMSWPEDAQTLSDHLLAVYKDPVHVVENLWWQGNDSQTLLEAARDIELGWRVDLTETQTGLSNMIGHVFAIQHEIDGECNHRVGISLETPYVLGTPFRLDTSALDSGHLLIY